MHRARSLSRPGAGEGDLGCRQQGRVAATEDVLAMIERLVRRLESEAQTLDGPGAGVMLDVEVGGVRCVLVRHSPRSPRTLLSPREEEIADLVASGFPNKSIASALAISCWTVSTHLRRVFGKLGVTSRASMVARLGEQRFLDSLRPADSCPPRQGGAAGGARQRR
ncbi:MAG TPA: helix-turn-helix transcriptional regulator [Thermoanaerobaculia bacterium]|nr:helix-turn-helix transcriptional regulator [Thermoanaerobaculia bacterium]